MLTKVVILAVLGFGLGFRLRMFSLLAATLVIAIASWAFGLPLLEIVIVVAIFQLAALAAMFIRHKTRQHAASFGIAGEDAPVSNDQTAILR